MNIGNRTEEKEKKVEIRMVDDRELPPIVITMTEQDEPKVIVNTYHRIWIGLNRRIIAGIIDNLQERHFELEDRVYENEYNEGSE